MSRPLEAAAAIGDTLVREALWHEGRCTWLGADGDDPGPRHATLPGDLYDGVAGVGLFLGHLAAVTGDDGARRTAAGALAQALWRTERGLDESSDGLYAGPLGVALAAVRVGSALGDEDIRGRGVALAARCAAADGDGNGEGDIVFGCAGRIVALRALGDDLGDAGEAAVRTAASALMRAASRIAMTGFAHGMSGSALALLEAWRATGDEEMLAAAEGLVAAERVHLDEGMGVWADLRSGGDGGARAYAVAWCHGAGGIALARLRALELTGAPWAREEALIALAATDRHARAALEAEGFDLAPCHGLTGLVEVLMEGEAVLGDAWTGGRALATDLVDAAGERHVRGRLSWPCGVPCGETPALMTGLAGIGLFFLRLHDPSIPSVLLVRPSTTPRAAAGPSRSVRG